MSDTKPEYDFDFITRSLGLVPINGELDAINAGAVVCIETDDDSREAIITIHSEKTFVLNASEMAELEATIKRRAAEAELLQREAIKKQMLAQYEIGQELQNGVMRAAGIIQTDKRGRH